MHEMGIALEVVRIAREVAEAQGAARVTGVRVRVGGWSGAEPESLRFALETLVDPVVCGEGDAVAGARIELDLVAPEFSCAACGARYGAESYFEPCPACGGVGGELVAGNELEVAELEVEEE